MIHTEKERNPVMQIKKIRSTASETLQLCAAKRAHTQSTKPTLSFNRRAHHKEVVSSPSGPLQTDPPPKKASPLSSDSAYGPIRG
ncbi:hypothetical protein AVEN_33665-1 [Araneus ventricosus]|uniref:Uncharacterized protein n=1 Tax=Araneus ventricosus TaxID=182803 RepID=A0A4Y2J2B0_ARAVE|nr:hypothetical protein AVEN_33665-1 [Araneus ventricosus]